MQTCEGHLLITGLNPGGGDAGGAHLSTEILYKHPFELQFYFTVGVIYKNHPLSKFLDPRSVTLAEWAVGEAVKSCTKPQPRPHVGVACSTPPCNNEGDQPKMLEIRDRNKYLIVFPSCFPRTTTRDCRIFATKHN